MTSAEITRLPVRRRSIRVAHVITRFIAGAGGVALRGASGLDPSRFQSTIITAPGGPLIERAELAGLEVLTLRHMRPDIAPVDDIAGVAELRGLLAVGGFDIVHTHSAKAGALGRIAAHRAGVPVVVHTFHGFPFHAFQSRVRRGSYLAIERRLGRITDRFVAVSSAVAADAIRLGIAPPERVRVIFVSVDENRGQSGPASRALARGMLAVPGDAPLIGTVGRVDDQKAPLQFVDAIAAVDYPDLRAVWIGDGPLRPAMEARIQARGLGGASG